MLLITEFYTVFTILSLFLFIYIHSNRVFIAGNEGNYESLNSEAIAMYTSKIINFLVSLPPGIRASVMHGFPALSIGGSPLTHHLTN